MTSSSGCWSIARSLGCWGETVKCTSATRPCGNPLLFGSSVKQAEAFLRRTGGVAWDLSLARVLSLMPNAVLIGVQGLGVSSARALTEKPGDFRQSRIVLVDKDRMAWSACASDPGDAF